MNSKVEINFSREGRYQGMVVKGALRFCFLVLFYNENEFVNILAKTLKFDNIECANGVGNQQSF